MINFSVASKFSAKRRKREKNKYIYKETFIKVTQTSAMFKIAVVIVSDDDILRKHNISERHKLLSVIAYTPRCRYQTTDDYVLVFFSFTTDACTYIVVFHFTKTALLCLDGYCIRPI